MLMQDCKHPKNAILINEIHGVRKAAQKHTAHFAVLHRVALRIVPGALYREIQLQDELKAQLGLLRFIPSGCSFGLRVRLGLNIDPIQLRSFASNLLRISVHGRPGLGSVR